MAWLKKDFGLGRGHAMAIVMVLKQVNSPPPGATERIDRLFSGRRSRWRKPYERLLAGVRKFGTDVAVSPTDTYISLLRNSRKFSILQATADRLDVGIKLKGVPPHGRFKLSGSWNAMVTHRVQVTEPGQIDAEVISWLRQAYDKAR